MTDLIARAREQWCCLEYVRETVHGEQVTGYYSCPPEIVAALLDTMAVAIDADGCPDCGRTQWLEHSSDCKVAAAYWAIEKALNMNPLNTGKGW